MAWDYIEGKWKEMRGRVRERWGKLTDERQVSEFEQSNIATSGRSER
jgi:hypothetical protein